MSRVSALLSQPDAAVAPTSPPARRSRRPSWRDPRLAVGLLLVAGSVVTGASLLGEAEGTTEVLAVRTGVAVGTPLDAGDLVGVSVRFTAAADAERYLDAAAGVPEGAVLVRPVGAGELLPRDAVGAASEVGLLEVPVPVSPERMAAGVRSGAVVDVWVAPDDAGGAERLLESVPVRSVSRPGAGGGLRQVVVAVPQDQHQLVARLVSRLDPQQVLVALRRN